MFVFTCSCPELGSGCEGEEGEASSLTDWENKAETHNCSNTHTHRRWASASQDAQKTNERQENTERLRERQEHEAGDVSKRDKSSRTQTFEHMERNVRGDTKITLSVCTRAKYCRILNLMFRTTLSYYYINFYLNICKTDWGASIYVLA